MANKELLDQVNKTNRWVLVKKTAYMWGKELTQDQEIVTLEGKEKAKAGQILCKGIAGELWPQEKAQVLKRYNKTEMQDGEWTKYTPRRDLPGYWASPVKGEFEVKTKWGTMKGKDKDYILKNFNDAQTRYPEDVWVVDRKLFNKSYAQSQDPNHIMLVADTLGIASEYC
eukprot:TRINITY_DN18168_c0_g1_i1.p1 TRINITY_DN18168_c0_g1~~TRINITY_DN18168_c0_g1_i1.p1  ORF type:complete len:170 (+),score=42.52 TRINITY_DN18168_c0_g1_i1:57-566(+)